MYNIRTGHTYHRRFHEFWLDLSNFVLNGSSKKDIFSRIISIKSILHSQNYVKNDTFYDNFIEYTNKSWLSNDDRSTDSTAINNNDKVILLRNILTKSLTNMQRLKNLTLSFVECVSANAKLIKRDQKCIIYLLWVINWSIFAILIFILTISKLLMPYLAIKWILFNKHFSFIEYFLCFGYILSLFIIIIFLIIIYKQRKYINYIIAFNEKWDSIQIGVSNAISFTRIKYRMETRYNALIVNREIMFILRYYFIEEIANIIWLYSCGAITYKGELDFELIFNHNNLGIKICGNKQSTGVGLYVANILDDAPKCIKNKVEIGSQIISVNNINIEHLSMKEALLSVQQLDTPLVIVFRPP